jgi:2-alkyl-3-oxoalkanoate reductase
MRVLVIGASGAIGSRLVPQLIEHGHEVVGSARSPAKAEQLRRFGARPIVLDILDAGAVGEAVAAARADAIIFQASCRSSTCAMPPPQPC